MMVTFEPSLAQTEPSSRPIAPAPITTSSFGTWSNARASSLVTIVCRSMRDIRQLCRHAAGGQHNVFPLKFFLAAILFRQDNFPGSDHLSDSKEPGDLVFLHQEFKPLRELPNHALFSFHHLRQIEADIFEFESVSGSLVLSKMKMIRRQQKRLAWNASDVETGASQNFSFVDNRRIEAELSGPNRSGVSGRASAQNNEIERRHGGMVDRNVNRIKEGSIGVAGESDRRVGVCGAEPIFLIALPSESSHKNCYAVSSTMRSLTHSARAIRLLRWAGSGFVLFRARRDQE